VGGRFVDQRSISPVVRDEYVKKMAAAGYSVRRIAKAVGMSPTGVYYILKPRTELLKYEVCDGCGENVRVEAAIDGLCGFCHVEARDR
jgi:predicted transcriptional regulator